MASDRAYAPGEYSYPDAGSTECTFNDDCPTSYTCDDGVCVPPEHEEDQTVNNRPPAASPHYVYALNPTSDSVARIDPATLAIEAIAVAAGPVDLVALSMQDVAVVLSKGDPSLSIIDSTTLPSRLIRVSLKHPYEKLAVSADGAFAIAYPDSTKPPASGAEGIVTVVSLAATRSGADLDQTRFERAAGFRVTDVIFRLEDNAATRAYVLSKSTLSIIDLADLAASPLPIQIALPTSMSADVRSREVVATADGARLMLRSTAEPELAYFDDSDSLNLAFQIVELPEVATDLDLLQDGSAAVAALRSSGKLAILELSPPFNSEEISTIHVTGVAVGQVALPPAIPSSGNFALVYSNATNQKSFAHVDLSSGVVTPYALQKLVEEIDISPDGLSAVIIHRADPDSHATDPYEKEVDKAQGYSVFDVKTGLSQLKTTGTIVPGPCAFSPQGGYLGVALRDDSGKSSLDDVDLHSLVANTVSLASAPLYMGPVPAVEGTSQHRVFISQAHPGGRISVIDLKDGMMRTVTGFTLNSEIE